jgi:hypothetical protein
VARAEVVKSQGSTAMTFTTSGPCLGGFVLLALAAEDVAVLFGGVGPPAGATPGLERQRGEVRAL